MRVKNFDFVNFIEKNYMLNRAPLTDDMIYFTKQIKDILPNGRILNSKSNEECLSWITPPSWDVKYAILKNENDETIIDFKNNPLHLLQYSSSFKGELSFSELEKHLHYSEEEPNEIPFKNRKQYQFRRDESWGICLPFNQFKSLDRKSKYFVDIKVEFSEKEMPVFDYHIAGKKNETIFFAAHSCHPGQVNDGIACVALLIKLFKWIETIKNRKYSYRLIIGPEYFAPPVFLTKAEKIDDLKFGFFLDMMVHEEGPLSFSSTYTGDSLVDLITETCMNEQIQDYKKFEYRRLWGNDEMFYDGPDFKIPTICLGRPDFKKYHTSGDDMKSISNKSVTESFQMLQNIIKSFEKTRFVKRVYKGPLYLSRFDLYIDPKIDRQGYKNLQNIQIEMNGNNTNEQIANKLGINVEFVNKFADSLLKNNLAIEE